jgi:4a-hydroxytetrahydrobiopterin dehydratase
LVSFKRERESVTDRTIFLSCIAFPFLVDTYVNGAVKGPCLFAKLNTKAVSTVAVPKLLSSSEIDARLKSLPGWKQKGKFITRTYEFDHFMDGIGFIDRIARIAEKEEHHPDIQVRYTTITLRIQTHSEGGVTDWDLELATAIEKSLTGDRVRRQARNG